MAEQCSVRSTLADRGWKVGWADKYCGGALTVESCGCRRSDNGIDDKEDEKIQREEGMLAMVAQRKSQREAWATRRVKWERASKGVKRCCKAEAQKKETLSAGSRSKQHHSQLQAKRRKAKTQLQPPKVKFASAVKTQ
ncbi:hypothetical protein NDA11_005740 [Ustilago hordei]|uniref:Uncharacterized protein n=1 Tax=Ustilago hordei TaxID=120017 RepID=I2FPF3_USTHO|nr:uncharacterized protein UHO2_06659 [Ustilago hordei]KAJ1038058.1 hypothetical protein NDA10_005832 [Ustilago hordei]KAJ1595634.1 hypothetical protein NDA11_005740 [Ustilago hordei]UTT88284.1 hypothetical protein NDA17_003909 [Ustilago hordei]CCF48796.1 uncharacterized protein UHOR_08839 [Ustilago hordei]SYW85007.1 uncharacterized protein UHO2_06659 [Ustilago hordei]